MEEVISLIFRGFNVVKELEINLPNLVTHHGDLINSFDEIIRVFGDVRDRLNVLEVAASYGGDQVMYHELSRQMEIGGGGGVVQDWLRFSQAMDMAVLHASHEVHHGLPESGREDRMGLSQAANARESGDGDVAVQPLMHVGDTAGGSPVQRTRRRNEADRRTIRVPAPRMGNTEVPPEDGYTWRKYGQKEILGSRFPRAYYRCTHQKLYNCPAKKQVQRLDYNPYMFEVTYRGDHLCTMSTTAPSIPPPPSEPITSQSPPVRPTASVPLSHWLSMDIRTSGDGTPTVTPTGSTNFDMQMYRDQFGRGGAGPSGTTTGGGSGSSTGRYADYNQGVADLADAMFNSGSSSMELIFSSGEEKWDVGDKKN